MMVGWMRCSSARASKTPAMSLPRAARASSCVPAGSSMDLHVDGLGLLVDGPEGGGFPGGILALFGSLRGEQIVLILAWDC